MKTKIGFIPGMSTTETVIPMRQPMEKFKKKRKNLQETYIDFGKAYNKKPMQLIW